MKKLWRTPELVVLVRGRAEEAVLTMCKASGLATTSSSLQFGCASIPVSGSHPASFICNPCDLAGTS